MVTRTRHLVIFPDTVIGVRLQSELADFGWQAHCTGDIGHAIELAGRFNCLTGLCLLENGTDTSTSLQIQQLFNAFEKAHHSLYWLLGLTEETMHVSQRVCKESQLIAQFCHDYLILPISMEKLLFAIGHAHGMAELTIKQAHSKDDYEGKFGIIGSSPQMRGVYENITKVTKENYPVLIEGETGTGKEMVARAIHNQSPRTKAPFIAINCGAFPKDLIQAELFGHEKGAFTGAHQKRFGRIEAAQGGTLFLDEIGDLPLDQQVNLLRFLEEKTITRIGGSDKISIDVRIISATHVDLKQAVAHGQFREDLYYRLRVLRLHVPPLRERDGDIEKLAWYFFNKFSKNNSYKAKGFNIEALELLGIHAWPGNIREMMNSISHALVMSDNRLLTPMDLNLERRIKDRYLKTIEMARAEADKDTILTCLRHTHFNMALAAQTLGISRASLYRLIEKYQLSV